MTFFHAMRKEMTSGEASLKAFSRSMNTVYAWDAGFLVTRWMWVETACEVLVPGLKPKVF